MTPPTLVCDDERRRHEVRRRERNGLDYLEVGGKQTTLTVYFLGAAPEGLTRENVRITGGRRIRDIEVKSVVICPQHDPELDNCMVVTVDKPGDFSTYTLCLVNLPEDTPFDPRYRCLEFTFKADCPADLDCKASDACPPAAFPAPEISYLAKDYASFRRLILDRLAVLLPEWKERHIPDIGITLVELFAYVGDHLSYYQDAVATEAYLDTARQRVSVRRHARLVDYVMHEGCNARAWVHVHTSADVKLAAAQLSFLTRPDSVPDVEDRLLRWEDLRGIPTHQYEVFEPLLEAPTADVEFRTSHNEIRIYSWGDTECCLPRGATSATLVDGVPRPTAEPKKQTDESGKKNEESAREGGGRENQAGQAGDSTLERVLELRVGDVLIFEEVVGPKTGAPADADPARRHAVRLTRVEPALDELYAQPLLEVEWSEEDALPFPLCVSVIGPPPKCALIDHVSVARGNVLLVDHGRRTEEPEKLGCVPAVDEPETCEEEGRPSDRVRRPGRFRPVLAEASLTFAEPLRRGGPAARLLDQDPRAALPWIRLWSQADPDCGAAGAETRDTPARHWIARGDLLASGPEDDDYVVEMDGRRRAHLRFGNGELGRQPEPGNAFQAHYRVGNGPAGNAGADTLVLAVSHDLVSGVTLRPRNPLPARGGTAPEPDEEVKLFAPHAFRQVLERAITPGDYALLAGRYPKVHRAAAELRWNGSWHEVRVAIDPLGHAEADAGLLEEIEEHLYRFRRIGHDLDVRPARYVPLDLVLEACVKRGFLRGHVKAALLERLGAGCLADGTRGFFHVDELSFGDAISLSRLVAVAQAVPGVESVALTRLERLFEGPANELEEGVLPIGPLEVARLDNDLNFLENGRIRFELRGGR
jgi:hypothetical protein